MKLSQYYLDTWGNSGILRMFNPIQVVRNMWRHRDLIKQMIYREVGQRYQGSYLGILWSFIVPLVMLAIYTLVFSVIFSARWQADTPTPPGEFALTLFAGLAAFNLFSEVVGRAPILVLAVPNYVKKVVFPLEVLPVVAVGSSLINSLIAVGLLLMGSVLLFGRISPTLFLLPLAYLPLILLCLGLGWMLASLGVYIRDVGQGVGIIIQMLYFLSPVFFPASVVPEFLRAAMCANPLTLILTSFRQTLLWGEVIDWAFWLPWTFGLSVFALAGYGWFMQTKKGFADVM